MQDPKQHGHTGPVQSDSSAAATLDIARAFVGARLAAVPLAAYPGALPADLSTAYAAALPGGPLEALRFVLGHLAERGRSLCAGQWVSTGAITGVHQILPGQQGSIELRGHGRIDVRIITAMAAGAQSAYR